MVESVGKHLPFPVDINSGKLPVTSRSLEQYATKGKCSKCLQASLAYTLPWTAPILVSTFATNGYARQKLYATISSLPEGSQREGKHVDQSHEASRVPSCTSHFQSIDLIHQHAFPMADHPLQRSFNPSHSLFL